MASSSDEYHESGDEYVPTQEDFDTSADSEESSDAGRPSTSQPKGKGVFSLKMFRSKAKGPKTSTPKSKTKSSTDRLNKSAPASSSSSSLQHQITASSSSSSSSSPRHQTTASSSSSLRHQTTALSSSSLRHQTTASSSSSLQHQTTENSDLQQSESTVTSESPVSSALLACMQRIEKHVELVDKRVKYLTAVVEKGQQEASQSKKAVKDKLTVPSHIKSAVHDGYRAGEDEKGYSWITKDGERVMKTKSEENKEMSTYIKTFVKGLYPDTQDGVIQAGIEIYFCSIKQKNQKKREGKMEAHKNKMLRYGRKQRKLEWRKKSVQHKKGWDEAKRRKVTKSLELAYMSSEEEVNSDDETIFKIIPLPWRSEEFNNICMELDAKNDKIKSARSKRQMVKRIRGTVASTRPKPQVDPENSWVLKQ